MSELKLLPCPFCGAEAELMIFNSEYGTVTAGCTNEDCDITMGKAFFTDAEAIEHWNRRKPMDNIVEKLEKELLTSQSAHIGAASGMCGFLASGYSGEISAYKKAIKIVEREINKEN